ncbi:hypothetical protein [Bacillus xiapuensis]|uniref:hypothetical protein n=1 Tax=Bacillus xiapuensis TaxID=2014075 RepID=UPI0012FDB401|nr:hypothetical protein [Bacillus xiapuensis]
MKKINDKMSIEKINDHFCLVEGKDKNKRIHICFFSMKDALAYSAERNYLSFM